MLERLPYGWKPEHKVVMKNLSIVMIILYLLFVLLGVFLYHLENDIMLLVIILVYSGLFIVFVIIYAHFLTKNSYSIKLSIDFNGSDKIIADILNNNYIKWKEKKRNPLAKFKFVRYIIEDPNVELTISFYGKENFKTEVSIRFFRSKDVDIATLEYFSNLFYKILATNNNYPSSR